MGISFDDVLKITSGRALAKLETEFSGFGFDSRADLSRKVFIALKGEAFDAHDFLSGALEKGAALLIVHRSPEELPILQELQSKVSIIQVRDTLLALHDLARAWRRQSPAIVVGVAGSNGKTTSKEFCASVIGAHRRIHYSKGSFNNHWGVPFTILAAPEKNLDVLILEMGMNHEGELAALAKIGEVDVAVVTYVGVEHIEHFGSLDKIAKAEEEIYIYSSAKAQRIYNLDNSWTAEMYQRAAQEFPEAKRIWSFSSTKAADVQLQIKEMTMSSLTICGKIGGVSGETTVPVFGSHNLTNLMVAGAVSLSVGLTPENIWSSLSKCHSTWGRNQLLKTRSGAEILFDGYNANPDSMKALLENIRLLKVRGKLIGVFGQMKELGEHAPKAHEELGRWVGQAPFSAVWFSGEDCAHFERGIKSVDFKNKLVISSSYEDSLASEVASMLNNEDIALVKGSRGAKLERFILACNPLDFQLNK